MKPVHQQKQQIQQMKVIKTHANPAAEVI